MERLKASLIVIVGTEEEKLELTGDTINCMGWEKEVHRSDGNDDRQAVCKAVTKKLNKPSQK